MVQRISTLICQVSDMERAVAFYSEILGLAPGYRSTHWTSFDLGGIVIGLHPTIHRDMGKAASWIIGFDTPDISALYARLIEHDARVADDYHDTPSGVTLDLWDPDGNPLQAMQRGVLMKDLV